MSETAKHTPGEWVREGLTIYALDESGTNNRFYTQVQGGWSWRSLNCNGGGTRTSEEELEANARLIAAAPEMLEALKELRWVGNGMAARRAARAKADAAIARAATGEGK